MDELINKRETVDALMRWTCDKYDGRSAFDVIRQMPPARPEPKRGKWIHISEEMWKCDQCGEISCCSPNFCPDCGSDMRQRGEQNG